MNEILKIGHVVPTMSSSGGGITEALGGLATAMSDQGAKVRIFSGEEDSAKTGKYQNDGYVSEILPIVGPRKFGIQRGLRHAVKLWNPMTLQVHGLWMYPSWATRYWRKNDIPYVVSPHGMLDPWALNNSAQKKKIAGLIFENTSLRSASCIHALNEREAEAIRQYGLTNPIAIIPNGIETSVARDILKGDNKTLLYLGRIHPKKSLEELLSAWKILDNKKALDGWVLHVAGWGDEEHVRAAKDLCFNLKLESSVSFLGPVYGELKRQTYSNATAFVLPSKSEGLPMSILEAWSYEIPVLMTDECNLESSFDHGAALRISYEPRALSEQIAQFISTPPQQRKLLGDRGGRFVRENYDWGSVAQKYLDLHRWVAGCGRRPDFVFD